MRPAPAIRRDARRLQRGSATAASGFGLAGFDRQPRAAHSATVLASGQVLIAGSVFGQSSSALRALAMRTQTPCMLRARFAPAAV